MATLDEILGGSPPDGRGNAPKGPQRRTEQNPEENAPVSSPAVVKNSEAPPAEKSWMPGTMYGGSGSGGGGGYEELYKKLNPYTPPTPDELEKERKKQKRAQIFAVIGDGIAALSNLYFATQYAPNMYAGKSTMSERAKVSYDKMKKERDEKTAAYNAGLMKARQADEAAAERERNWRRQLGLDEEARQRYKESIEHRNERERVADDRYNKEQADKKARKEEENRRWKIQCKMPPKTKRFYPLVPK